VSGVAFQLDAADALRRLGSMLAFAQDPGDALDAIGFDFSQRADRTFDDQADPWNAAWRPLSPVTLALRRGGGGQILRDTGRLSASITHLVQGDEVRIGTNVEYAATHQLGRASNRMFGRSSAPIPARAFLPIREDGRPDLPSDWERSAINIVGNLLEAARDGA
jgi:phage virion morphogenesis protein